MTNTHVTTCPRVAAFTLNGWQDSVKYAEVPINIYQKEHGWKEWFVYTTIMMNIATVISS